jgi:mono/diheme cytochrome c family protein
MRWAALVIGTAMTLWAVLLAIPRSTTGQSGPQPHGHHAGAASDAAATAPAPRRIGSEELHRLGGVPRGWTFTLPAGDAARGRQVFADLECYKCHRIAGESFPAAELGSRDAGPDLTGMGAGHSAEYFAESILSPNAVIVTGPGHTGPDGLSTMPGYADSLSVAQLVDLVAFLKSLTAGGHDHAEAHQIERQRVVGDYRVRLVLERAHEHPASPQQPGGAQQRGGHQHHGRQGGGTPGGPAAPPVATSPGHLMVFVSDREWGEAVPYLPVTATFHAPGATPRTAKLSPMVGARGFHYGADVALPARTGRISVVIGAPGIPVTAAGRRYAPVTVDFEWPGGGK